MMSITKCIEKSMVIVKELRFIPPFLGGRTFCNCCVKQYSYIRRTRKRMLEIDSTSVSETLLAQ